MTDKTDAMLKSPLTTTQLEQCADRLSLFAHEIRLQIIIELMNCGSCTVSELLKTIRVEQNLLSHHLRLMREVGLVATMREGKYIRYALASGVSTKDRVINLGCCQFRLSEPTA